MSIPPDTSKPEGSTKNFPPDLSKSERERLETWGWTPMQIDDAVAAMRSPGISACTAEDVDAGSLGQGALAEGVPE